MLSPSLPSGQGIQAMWGSHQRRGWVGFGRLGNLGALALAGCTPVSEDVGNGFKVGPNYRRPPAPVAPDWIDADDVRLRRTEDEPAQWWTVLNDPVLDALVCNV